MESPLSCSKLHPTFIGNTSHLCEDVLWKAVNVIFLGNTYHLWENVLWKAVNGSRLGHFDGSLKAGLSYRQETSAKRTQVKIIRNTHGATSIIVNTHAYTVNQPLELQGTT